MKLTLSIPSLAIATEEVASARPISFWGRKPIQFQLAVNSIGVSEGITGSPENVNSAPSFINIWYICSFSKTPSANAPNQPNVSYHVAVPSNWLLMKLTLSTPSLAIAMLLNTFAKLISSCSTLNDIQFQFEVNGITWVVSVTQSLSPGFTHTPQSSTYASPPQLPLQSSSAVQLPSQS